MGQVTGFDHVAVTVADVETFCAFYRDVLGATTLNTYEHQGKTLLRQILIGGAMLSVHQEGNGLELVARRPTPGAVDLCMRWSGTIEEAADLLRRHKVAIIEGPAPRKTADLRPSQSIYFRDPDGNLIELMAADPQ